MTDTAQWVFDTIAKMDPGEARLFTVLFAEELQSVDANNNARQIERAYDSVTKSMTDELANDFLFRLENGVDPEQLVAEAAAVAIAKSDDAWKFQERSPNGRWGRMTGAQYRAQKKVLRAHGKAGEADLKALRSKRLVEAGQNAGNDVGNLGPKVRDFEQSWNSRRSSESGSDDVFTRMASSGKLAAQVGGQTGRPALWAAGQAAHLVGSFGPEAEKVVGPAMRKASYRYRGTERTPQSKEILAEANKFTLSSFPAGEGGMAPQKDLKSGGTRPTPIERLDPAKKSFALQQGALSFLEGKVPSPKLAELHLQSGKVPPSEGVIINGEGEITAQAVGFADDHYLPFNLKKLGAIRGGQFVRTRTSGGLTSEDIYAGLVGGARSMSVVSRSGTFTLDFADDFRGARRNSDKAKDMVRRYEFLLDAVKSEQVGKQPHSAEERAEIREELEERITKRGLDPNDFVTEIEHEVNAELKNRLTRPRLTRSEIDDVKRTAWRGIDRNNPSDADRIEAEKAERQITRRKLSEKADTVWRLDGEGYTAALNALQEQFPYFIADVRTNTHKTSPERFGPGPDKGYVKPKYLKPTAARAGYFGDKIGPGKHSAEETGFANYRERRGTRSTETGSAPAPSGAPGAAPGQAAAPAQHLSQAIDQKEYEGKLTAAKKERDETTVKAAEWWRAELLAGNAASKMTEMPYPYPEKAGILDELADKTGEERDKLIAEKGNEIRAAVTWLDTQKHPDEAVRAPKIVWNEPKKPEAAPTNPFSTARAASFQSPAQPQRQPVTSLHQPEPVPVGQTQRETQRQTTVRETVRDTEGEGPVPEINVPDFSTAPVLREALKSSGLMQESPTGLVETEAARAMSDDKIKRMIGVQQGQAEQAEARGDTDLAQRFRRGIQEHLALLSLRQHQKNRP